MVLTQKEYNNISGTHRRSIDNEHRRQVHDENRQWGLTDSDKVYVHLKAAASRQKFKQPEGMDGKPIGICFNRGSCFMTYCKFSHICQICNGDYPMIEHVVDQIQTDQPPPNGTPLAPPLPRFRHS